MSVREEMFSSSSAHGPCGRGLAVKFFHYPIPHQFREGSMIFVVSLPKQGTVHSRQLLDVIFVCTHHSQFYIEILADVLLEVLW